MTNDIELRPVTEDDLAIIESLVETPAGGEFAWFGHPKPGDHRKRWAENGIGLVSGARGKGYGTITQRLLVDYLFAHTPAHRIEADTELENLAEQHALEKVGFTREGVIRQAVWRNGAWRDGVIYGILRDDLRDRA